MAKDIAKLEAAVKKQAANLDPAQMEFVLAEFETYRWNAGKIAKLQRQLDGEAYDADDVKVEGALLRERHQLVTEQAALFSHIMRWLKGTGVEEEDELGAFIGS